MARTVSITMNFGTASARKGGGEVSSVFEGIKKDARRTGQEVTKALNVRTDGLVRNLGQVEKALKRVQDIAKNSKLAEMLQAADRLARAEIQAAQRAAREKEKLAGEAVKRAQKVADAEAREAARLEREKVKIAERTAREEARAAQFAQREKNKIYVAELREKNKLEVEKLQAAERTHREEMRMAERAARERSRLDERRRRDAAREPGKAQMASDGMQQAGRGMVAAGSTLTAAVTVPLAVFAKFALDIGTQYDEAMNMLQVATSATSEQMERAAQVAVDLGADMTLPATSAANAALAMLELGKAGFTIEQSMVAAKGVLQLAAAANLDEARAAEIAANAINTFGLAAADSTRVSDLLAASANASSAEITDVAAAMQQAGLVFKNANIPLEDLVTSIAMMANAGVKGSDAGTSLKTMVQRLTAPTKEARKELQHLIGGVYDGQRNLKSYHQIITELTPALAKMSEEQRNAALLTIFGQDAMRAALVIFGQGAEAYDKMRGAVTKQGAAAEMAAARTKGLGGAWKGLISQIETFALLVYNQLKGPLETAVRAVADVVGQLSERFNSFAAAHPNLVLIAAGLAAVAAAVGPALVVLGGIVMAIGGIVGSVLAVKAAVVALGGVTAVLVLTGKVFLALAAVFAVVAAAAVALYVAWQQNLGGIRDFTGEVVGAIRSAVGEGLQFVTDLWARHGEQITAAATTAWGAVSSVVTTIVAGVVTLARENFGILVDWVRENWPLIRETIVTVLQAVGSYVQERLAAIQSFWLAHGEQIKTAVSAAWVVVKAIIQTGLHVILGVIKMVMQIINGDWAGAWETFKGIVRKSVEGMQKILGALGSVVWGLLKSVANGVIQQAADFLAAGMRVGSAIVEGIVGGIKRNAVLVLTATREMAKLAIFGAKNTLESKSPSRVFFRIGRDVALGFLLGVGSMQAEAQETLSRLVIPERPVAATGKGSSKANAARRAADQKNRPGYDLLEKLYQDIDNLAPAEQRTKRLSVEAALASSKFKDLAADVRAALVEAADFYDRQKAGVSVEDMLNRALDDSAQKLLALKHPLKEGATELEKFDLAIQQARDDSPAMAAALDLAAGKIERVRKALADVDAREKARETRAAAEQLSNAVAEMADESGVALRDLGTSADTNLEKFIARLADLKGLTLNLSQLNPIKDLAASIKALPPEERLTKIAEALERIMSAAGARPAGLSDAEWKKFVGDAAKGIDNSVQVDEQGRTTKALELYRKALEELDGKMAEVNGQLNENNKLTEAARVHQELLRGAYKELTDEQKQALVTRAAEIDQRKKEIDEALKQREKLEELADSITGVFDRALDDLFEHGFKGFFKSVVSGFKDMFQQVVKDFLLSGINKLFRGLLGLETGTAGGTASGGGNFFSSLLGGLGKLFGLGGGSASATTPGFSGGAIPGLFQSGGIASVFKHGGIFSAGADFGPSLTTAAASTGSTTAQVLTDTVAGSTKAGAAKQSASSLGSLLQNSGSLFKGIGFNAKAGSAGPVATMLPFLGAALGGSLVSSLAGPQAGGLANILGMVGGGLVGVGLTATPAIFAAGGSLASMGGVAGALFSNPITAIAGAALLVGGILLGKQKQRRADETARDDSMVGSLKALNDILGAVELYPAEGGIPVKDALDQAQQVKQQYLEAARGLKDKKTRNHALKDVSRLDAVISRIEAAGVGQKSRLEMIENRKPEFADGGVIPGRPGSPQHVIAHGGEVVVNWSQLSGVGAAVMALAGVPGLGALPSVPSIAPARPDYRDGGGSSGGGDIIVEELRFRFDNAGRLFVEGGRSRDGRRLIIETVHDVEYEGGR